MTNTKRVLFISGEVAPFTKPNALSSLVRSLPEQLNETGQYEMRIMMPRYGIISERRNRLHEVIRLSGSEISMGDESHVLKVKVASIPGIRLQVYFMDNVHYFKRKGIIAGRDGAMFEDNAERALFLGRSVMQTIKNLGWSPDIVHCFGWASAFVPLLLKTELAGDPLFENSRSVFSPCDTDAEISLTAEEAAMTSVDDPESLIGLNPTELGLRFADASIAPPHVSTKSGPQFGENADEQLAQVCDLYESLVSDVVA